MRPLRLTDVVIPDPFQNADTENDSLLQLLQPLQRSVRQVLKQGVEMGVLNAEDSRDIEKLLRDLTSSVNDVLFRVHKVNQLHEGITREEYYDLRYRWKDAYKLFLKFRDILRNTKNVLLQGGLISRQVGDEILDQTEEYCRMLDQLDNLIQKTISELFQNQSGF